MSNLFLIFLTFLLVFLNALFVAAEFGMVRLRNTQVAIIEEMAGLRGRILSKIHENLDAYLSACQLGITLASLGLGWIGQPVVSSLLEPLVHQLGIQSHDVTTVLSFFIAFAILSFLHIVVGELMPKSLAIRQPGSVSLWTAIPLYGFYWLMYPAIWLLNGCSTLMLKMVHLDVSHPGDSYYSADEIRLILNASHSHGELTKDEAKIIEHTLDFTELSVTEVMRPSDEMIEIELHTPLDELLERIQDHRYSRYPVRDNNINDIIGIIHIKDLFPALYQEQETIDLTDMIRPILKVSHRLPALNLLQKFRAGVPHFALVYRQEKLIGFVTLDNLLHAMIGRIKDEFHRTKNDWIKNKDGTFTVKGDCSIYSLERALDRDITLDDDEEELNTISELILHRLSELPAAGQNIEFPEFTAIIAEKQDKEIETMIVYPKAENED